ncbi:MAG TPA: oligosaccharide flippase family protein [Candidatus Woesebacteria bacterium]|nr:oligosaccharide flippase family protein [Candidatus Woesebacteria bacterium]
MIKNLLRSPASQQSLLTAGANLLSAGLMGIAFIVLGRLLGPSNFGIFSVSISLMLIFNQVISGGINQLMPRFIGHWYQFPKKQTAFLQHLLFWQLILAMLLVAGGVIFQPVLTRLFNYPYPTMLLMALAGAVFLALYNDLYYYYLAKQQFLQAGLLNIAQSLLKVLAFALIIVAWQGNLVAISSAYYLALLVVPLIFLLIDKQARLPKPQALGKTKAEKINRLWRHAWIATLSVVLVDNFDLLLVQRFSNDYQAGLYSGAMKIAMFMSLIGASLETVINSRVARYQNKQTLRDFLQKSRILILLSIVLSILVIPLSELLIKYTLGSDYVAATGILKLLLINVFLTIIVLPLAGIFYAIDQPNYFSRVGLMRVVIIFGLSVWLLPQFGAPAAAASRIVATVAVLIYSLVAVKKELKSS